MVKRGLLIAGVVATITSALSAQAKDRRSATELLTPAELAEAFADRGLANPARPPRTRKDTVDLLRDAAMWNWEDHGKPRPTIRWYCAALALGIPDSASYALPVEILSSYQAYGPAIDVLREAARRWPRWDWPWRQLVSTYSKARQPAAAAKVQRQLDAGRIPALPEAMAGGCDHALRRR